MARYGQFAQKKKKKKIHYILPKTVSFLFLYLEGKIYSLMAKIETVLHFLVTLDNAQCIQIVRRKEK